jgi:hypothetical protein
VAIVGGGGAMGRLLARLLGGAAREHHDARAFVQALTHFALLSFQTLRLT